MKTSTTLLAATLLTTTASAGFNFKPTDLTKAIKAYSVPATNKIRSIPLAANPNSISVKQIKLSVKKAFPAATHIKVSCPTHCSVQFIENLAPKQAVPNHVNIDFNGNGH